MVPNGKKIEKKKKRFVMYNRSYIKLIARFSAMQRIKIIKKA